MSLVSWFARNLLVRGETSLRIKWNSLKCWGHWHNDLGIWIEGKCHLFAIVYEARSCSDGDGHTPNILVDDAFPGRWSWRQ